MTINETDWNVDEVLDAPDYVGLEDVDVINLIDDPAVPSVEVGATEAPTRHDFSYDSRDRIKSLKGMVSASSARLEKGKETIRINARERWISIFFIRTLSYWIKIT